jgi:hypothetical protein
MGGTTTNESHRSLRYRWSCTGCMDNTHNSNIDLVAQNTNPGLTTFVAIIPSIVIVIKLYRAAKQIITGGPH